jgi:hypothetical protein
MMDGLAVPDDFISTELDGTYDKFGNIVVHWRNDGFIDFVALEHERDAELEFSKIIALQTAE